MAEIPQRKPPLAEEPDPWVLEWGLFSESGKYFKASNNYLVLQSQSNSEHAINGMAALYRYHYPDLDFVIRQQGDPRVVPIRAHVHLPRIEPHPRQDKLDIAIAVVINYAIRQAGKVNAKFLAIEVHENIIEFDLGGIYIIGSHIRDRIIGFANAQDPKIYARITGYSMPVDDYRGGPVGRPPGRIGMQWTRDESEDEE